MNEEIINKLDEITNIFSNDREIIELKEIKHKILLDKDLLNKINLLKTINEYDDKYISIKKEILSDKTYKRYVELENRLFFDIKDINIKLNQLIEKRGCH